MYAYLEGVFEKLLILAYTAPRWHVRSYTHNTLAFSFVLFSVSPAEDSTYSWPNRSLQCSSHPLVPMCVAINHHSICCSVTGSVSPSAPDDQNCSTSAGSSASAAFGLFPLFSLFRCFAAAFSTSHDDVKILSLKTLHVFCKS